MHDKYPSLRQSSVQLNRTEKASIILNVLVTAGLVSFLFLFIYFSYRQILLFTANELDWEVSNYILRTPGVYSRGEQWLILIYVFILTIAVIYQVMKTRDRIALSYIRSYISLMAQGDYHLRVPEDYAGEYLKLAQDINILMESINQALEDRDKAERSKDELMNNIGHDIRTPLTSVIGYLDLAKNPKTSDQDRQQYIEVAYNKSKEMRGLVNDLFDYTSSLNATIQLACQTIPLLPFVEQLAADFYLASQAKGVELVTDVSPEDLTLHMDPNKMARVFNNLITNALKYGTGASQIMVKAYPAKDLKALDLPSSCQVKRINPVKSWVILEVRNDGELLEEAELEKIFERSYRSDQSRNSKEKGSGLGLSIVKNFIQAHHGHVFALIEGQELVFRMCLPQANPENKLL